MRNPNPLVGDCVNVLRQGLALLDRLEDGQYAETGSLNVRSGIGSHFRHCLDFYDSFLAGVRTYRVDYNRRDRDPLLERDRSFAVTKLRILIEELETLHIVDGSTHLLVALEGSTTETEWCQSTVLRELQFLLSHTIHHYALIALILRVQGFEPDEAFGVNPSTLQHWTQEAAYAR